MIPDDSPFDSGPFSPETRTEIARRFGEETADVVLAGVARALREIAAEAEAVGVSPETAVAGFLHVCREFCEAIETGRRNGGGGEEAGLN